MKNYNFRIIDTKTADPAQRIKQENLQAQSVKNALRQIRDKYLPAQTPAPQ